ncbi:MAG: 30S ribosomal protein S9, partial [Anaerolineae bacterium]
MTEEIRRYYEGIGRRKRASARVRIYMDGATGNFTVNDKDVKEFFPRFGDYDILMGPLTDTELAGKVDVTVLIHGGGITGQTGAVRLGLARALVKYD